MKKTIIFLAFMLFSVLIFAQNVRLIGMNNENAVFGTTYAINTLVLDYATNRLFKLTASATATQTLANASKTLVIANVENLDLTQIKTLIADTATSVRNWVLSKNYLTSFTETDPIFNAQKSNYALQSWVTSQNYISNEFDPFFAASAAYSISTTDKANWNTAYRWGNHGSAGYLTNFTETDPFWSTDKPNYALQSWVTSQNYLTSFSETDPIWLSEKSNYITFDDIGAISLTETDPVWNSQKASYATQTWTNSQGFLKTETDPVWNSQKASYATIQALHDTASILRDDFNKFVIVDNSGLWVSTGNEVILSTTNNIVTVKNNKTYNFVKTSNSVNYTYIDSIEITNLTDVEIAATAKGTNTIGTFKHTVAYNNVAGTLNRVGINSSEIKCDTYPTTHFAYDVRANWLRFKVKSNELVTWKFKVEINYN